MVALQTWNISVITAAPIASLYTRLIITIITTIIMITMIMIMIMITIIMITMMMMMMIQRERGELLAG